MCQPHQWTMYKAKHDEVARCIQWSVARALDLIAHSASRAVPDVVNGPKGKVSWDPLCLTLRQMTERRPDLLVWQHQGRRLYIIEVAVADDLRVEEKTDEKRAKYRGLKGDLAAQHPGYKVLIVPAVVGNLGCVDSLEKELTTLQFLSVRQRFRLMANIQRTAIMASSRIIRNHLAW